MDVKSLVSQMTLEEKAKMCSGKSFWETEEIERLGIPSVMLTDGPCGIRKQEDKADHLGLNASISAVSYPTGSCIACSFDKTLLQTLGETLAQECQAEDVAVILGPAANIKRSPLCGRNFEYFSEDPYLAGQLSAGYIKGVQSKNVGVSLKHFACNNQETRRMTSNSIVDERSLRELYLAGFEAAVKEAKPWTVMCSYNKINGTYSSENHRLLTDILRKEWGFNGYVVSDWGASSDRVLEINAGMDLEMPGDNPANTDKILEAVKSGAISEETLNTAVERILNVTLRYVENKDKIAVFNRSADHETARRAAAESMVLLKNDDILPLKKEAKVAFIGKFAKEPRFQGGGSSHVNSFKVVGAVEAAEKLPVTYAQGYNTETDEPDAALIHEAVQAAQAAEAAVVFLGIPDRMESEGFDRVTLGIPECQTALLSEITKAQKNTIVVVECGGCIEMPWVQDVKGILYAYLGGEAVGSAIVDILYGDVNPSGKLAESFPRKLADNPSSLFYFGERDNVEYREGIFVGYRYYDKKEMEVLFPFGYGLSYTEFTYSDLSLSKKEISDTEELTATVRVKNTGSVYGGEAVQLYVANPKITAIRPVKELKGFQKIFLAPGEETTVSFILNKRSFAYYNTEISDWYAESGDYGIQIGKSSRDIVLRDRVRVLATNEIPQVFSQYSTVGDILESPIGAGIIEEMLTKTPLAGTDLSAIGIENIMDLVKDIPIKALASFGGGMISAEMIDHMLVALNEKKK